MQFPVADFLDFNHHFRVSSVMAIDMIEAAAPLKPGAGFMEKAAASNCRWINLLAQHPQGTRRKIGSAGLSRMYQL